jgi:hypothetical protein
MENVTQGPTQMWLAYWKRGGEVFLPESWRDLFGVRPNKTTQVFSE